MSTEIHILVSPLQYSSGTRQPALVGSKASMTTSGEDKIRLKKRKKREMSFFIVGDMVLVDVLWWVVLAWPVGKTM